MSEITADMLYEKLLEIKRSDPNHNFCGSDYDGLETQFQELVASGRVKITKPIDVIDSFELIG